MATRHTQTQTPLNSLCLKPSTQLILIQDLQKVLVAINKAVAKVSNSLSLLDTLEQTAPKLSELDRTRVRALKFEFKAINEMFIFQSLKLNLANTVLQLGFKGI